MGSFYIHITKGVKKVSIYDMCIVMEQTIEEFDIAIEAEVAPSSTSAPVKTRPMSSPDPNTPVGMTSQKTDSQKKVQSGRILERIKNILQKIGEFLAKVAKKFTTRIQFIIQSEKDWQREFNKVRSMQKPLQAIKLVNYRYDAPWLEKVVNSMYRDVSNAISAMTRERYGSSQVQALIASSGGLITRLCKPYISGTITNISELTRALTQKFRGEKTEILYKGTDVPMLAKYGVDEMRNRVKQMMDGLSNQYSSLRNLEIRARRAETKDAFELATKASTASTLFNIMSSVMNVYLELMVERALSYRRVLRKLYNF